MPRIAAVSTSEPSSTPSVQEGEEGAPTGELSSSRVPFHKVGRGGARGGARGGRGRGGKEGGRGGRGGGAGGKRKDPLKGGTFSFPGGAK
jgi:ATP-dependent RNA helicase DDX56/DBP9